MKPEKQRIAIAEECGWVDNRIPTITANTELVLCWISPGGQCYTFCPDYPNDLNAMHEAAMSLTWQQRDAMKDLLRDGRGGYFANAEQRAEAFLKTVGRWKE